MKDPVPATVASVEEPRIPIQARNIDITTNADLASGQQRFINSVTGEVSVIPIPPTDSGGLRTQ